MSRTKLAPRAVRTSDVLRPRSLLVAAIGAALGAALALGGQKAEGAALGPSRPLGRPHAGIACATCHEARGDVATPERGTACKSCHGESHGSTRPAHRALAARGAMTCATCHPAHAGAQGVRFGEDGVFRWGAGAETAIGASRPEIRRGTEVPLVALARCTGCHDPARARDPIAACVPATVRGASVQAPELLATLPSFCFDEHTTGFADARGGRASCSAQHGPDRGIVWDATRALASASPWIAAPPAASSPWIPLGGGLAGATALGLGLVLVERRRGAPAAKAPAAAPRKRLPTIDTSTCLGCYACVDACPFDVLAIERYVAVVARPLECCGVVLCRDVCPNGSLQIREGEVVGDRPATDEHLESRDAPGLFVAGDLTGLPLIKNAINQGVRVIDRIASLPRAGGDVDVVIVGAGPAGLAAALRAKERGLRAIVLEQATIAASIKGFPRDKIVHDPPLDLPLEGELWLREATKEEIVAQWTRIVRVRALDVREGRRVVDCVRDGDGFVVTTERDGKRASVRAPRVLFAIGRRGTPRRLEMAVEDGADEHIHYALADARSFAGKRVVIVGLGDAAMEAAIALARQPGTAVTVVYRGSAFQRGRARNVDEMRVLVDKGKIKLLFDTVPTVARATGVTLSRAGTTWSVPADALVVLVGGIPSWDLLTRAGLRRGS